MDITAYRKAVAAQQEEARHFVETMLRAYKGYVNFTTDEDFREYATEVLSQAFQRYGDAAAVVACQQYDMTATELGYDVAPADIANEWNAKNMERSVNYFMRNVNSGNLDAFVSQMVSKANDHVSAAANRTMIANADRKRDRSAGMRYARVPTGRETCGFCLMLASRGFIYKTKETAGWTGLANYYHDNCDCTVVCGNSETKIDGYDPDWYREVYKDARRTAGVSNSTKELNLLCNEINRRSKEWAWHGENGSVTYDSQTLAPEKYAKTAEKLAAHGFDIHFRQAGGGIYMTGSGRTPWEIKQPTGNGTQTIYHQFEGAATKTRRLVLDTSTLGEKWTDKAVEEEVEKLINWHYRGADGKPTQFIEALIVKRDGNIRRIKKEG